MIYNERERTIMANALQANMRIDIAVEPFEALVTDFGLRMGPGLRILDLGPGQCDLLDIARRSGADTFGIDSDPAACELGRLRGHTMIQNDLRHGIPAELGHFDGIFCRGSINLFWFQQRPSEARVFLENIFRSLAPNGWLWMVPWNKPAGEVNVDAISTAISEWSGANGIDIISPTKSDQRRYSLHYKIPSTQIWMHGLNSSTVRTTAGLTTRFR